MRVAIVRRIPDTSFSMDVYADGLISGLRAVRPEWEIVELQPQVGHTQKSKLTYKLGKYYEQYWHYPHQIKGSPADIFHIIDHSDGHLVRWLKSAAAPVVATCHDLINLLQPANANHQAILPALSSALWNYSVKGLKRADHVVTVSAHTAKDVRNLLDIPSQDLTVVHNAVEAVFHKLPTRTVESIFERYKIPRDCFYLLNVGSSQPRKNITALLEVFAKLINNIPGQPIHLIKAGADFTGEQRAIIQRYDLEKHITQIESPDKATLVKLYNAADVLVAPSLYEGFGITILEAMACGTPVITSNVSSLPEISGDAAILVEPRDVDAIATAILALKASPLLRQELIQRGLEHVKAFTWQKSAEKVAQVYEQLKR